MLYHAGKMVALSELGDRICILGPTNSGKSTLASAIAREIGTEAIFLDRLYHRPGPGWRPRPAAEFERLHDAAIAGPRWVMDGNYSRLLPKRLERATGFILLDISAPRSLVRYLRRSLFEGGRQIGGVGESGDAVTWAMLRHILRVTPANRRRYAALFPTISLPKVLLVSARRIEACYAAWGLTR